MAESALERFFDKYIADNKSDVEDEEDEEEQNEELFFKLLPDELLTYYKPSLDHICKSQTVKLKPKVMNFNTKANLGCMLDLHYIASHGRNVDLGRKSDRVHMRIRNPRCTGIIFKAGTLLCLGAKSKDQSRIAARRFARIVQKLGFPVRFLDFKICGIIAICRTSPIRLDQLANFIHSSYEPELSSTLRYQVTPGIRLIIHRTGTIYVHGAKSEAELNSALRIAESTLNSFRSLYKQEVCD
ncbi:TATA-box-binding protein-like isoform X1 [Xyrichtys novacula]|uniref:TATA-box-binding protein-like isoform X1 n=1 Tax=Xyrichtys novacula TaxID=13765 RepID=A0AAV1HB01_XYRNO|nr:TATA-box-binding protein-like isoform X1 [Xyrichtys novacula]